MSSTPGIAALCPQNATFYACDFGERFLGCCENGSPADICRAGCPQDHLLPASFEKENYDYITRAACMTGDWWSCANTSPPFLGCCLSNPCLDGCPPGDLTAAIFSQNQTDNPLYSAITGAPAAASATASSSASTAASSTPVHGPGAVHSATTSPSPTHKISTGRIVGVVVGGIVAVGGLFIGVLLLYRHLKYQWYKGLYSNKTNEKERTKDSAPQSSTVAKAPRKENEPSHELSTTIANREEGRVPIRLAGSTIFAPYLESRKPLGIYSTTSGATQEDHEDDKTPPELPPNHAPLPEIASSDSPDWRHELPSSGPGVQEHVHPRALQPGRPAFRPYSASNLSQVPQPYGHSFRPHSPFRLSAVSSIGSSPPLTRMSPFSATNHDISTDI